MSEWVCPFCQSKELRIKSEYVELKGDGTYGPVESFCCLAQKQNYKYAAKNYDHNEKVDLDEISKW